VGFPIYEIASQNFGSSPPLFVVMPLGVAGSTLNTKLKSDRILQLSIGKPKLAAFAPALIGIAEAMQ
jgi:hypothetical protein